MGARTFLASALTAGPRSSYRTRSCRIFQINRHSRLARLRREGALTVSKYTAAKREFVQQWPSFLTLDATNALCRTAGELVERYRLRGFDSVHLATFAEVARRAGARETRFSSFDDRLNQAAQRLARTLERQS